MSERKFKYSIQLTFVEYVDDDDFDPTSMTEKELYERVVEKTDTELSLLCDLEGIEVQELK